MIQITYISSSARPMDQNSLEDILVKSRKNNNEVGITGMLIYHNDTFLQVLEGNEEKIDTLMSKIKKDRRHTDCRIVSKKKIQQREYGEWNMGFKLLSEKDFRTTKIIEGFNQDNFNATFLSNNGNIVDSLMEHYRKERVEGIKHEEPLGGLPFFQITGHQISALSLERSEFSNVPAKVSVQYLINALDQIHKVTNTRLGFENTARFFK